MLLEIISLLKFRSNFSRVCLPLPKGKGVGAGGAGIEVSLQKTIHRGFEFY